MMPALCVKPADDSITVQSIVDVLSFGRDSPAELEAQLQRAWFPLWRVIELQLSATGCPDRATIKLS
jgi:hypothetical protein